MQEANTPYQNGMRIAMFTAMVKLSWIVKRQRKTEFQISLIKWV